MSTSIILLTAFTTCRLPPREGAGRGVREKGGGGGGGKGGIQLEDHVRVFISLFMTLI